jgi:Holliday junction resolvase RusA-like endonuclease
MANYETEIKYRFMGSIGKLFSPLDCPIKLTIEAVFSMPQSATKAEKTIGSRKKITKPDLDNLIKIVGDGLNGVAWVDDAKIYSISAIKKETTGVPFVRIIIEWDI